MGVRYDYASSILLCAEDNSSFLGLDDDDDDEEAEKHLPDWSLHPNRSGLYGRTFTVSPLQSDECLGLLMEKEVDHVPRTDYAKRLTSGYLDVSIRTDAIDWILEVHAYYNFGPLSAYLSVNYLDRFLSHYELPQGKSWMTQLLSVACLSLAAKMEEMEVPQLVDLQVGKTKFFFEARTIQRMELLLLSTLKWRMQAVTPFSFVEYFLRKLHGLDFPSEQLVSRAVKLILGTIRGDVFLAFKPSEIAAATALCLMAEEGQTLDVEKSIACCGKIDEARVFRCFETLREEAAMTSADSAKRKNWISSISSYIPQSPVGVLGAACLSCKTDEMISGLQASSHCTSPAEKRRKMSRPFVS